jgi:hypothetical protein
VFVWVKRYKGRRTSVDEARSETFVDVEEQVDHRIRDNRRIITGGSASEMIFIHGKKLCKNELRPNQKHFIPMEPGNLCGVVENSLKTRAVT